MIDETEDVFVSRFNEPLILEIYLNSNNYKDRIFISDLKKRANLVKLDNFEQSSFYVKVEDVEDILQTKFRSDILEFDTLPKTAIPLNATSIFFIDSMLREFTTLKYFKINISNTVNYTRKQNDKIIFDYKILHTKIDFANNCSLEFLSNCKEIFEKIGVYKVEVFHEKPYFEIEFKNLLYKLLNYRNQFSPEDDEFQNVSNILELFGRKLDEDDSTVLVIMCK